MLYKNLKVKEMPVYNVHKKFIWQHLEYKLFLILAQILN